MEIILGKTAGFCYGVERAVKGATEEATNNAKMVYCLGEIVHNKNVVQILEKQGIKFIEDIEEANGKTIIRAHGVAKQVYERAKEKNIELKDLTCPSVLKIHKIAEDYANRNYFIILTGKSNHPEVIGIKSYCGNCYSIVNNVEETESVLEKIKNENIENVLIISQTTFSSKVFDNIVKKIGNSFDKNIVIKKTICNSTEMRQKETEEIAKTVDTMIIIGDKKSSNTNKLYDISCDFCKNTIFICDEREINAEMLRNANKIGIMAGASTPKEDIEKVIKKMNL